VACRLRVQYGMALVSVIFLFFFTFVFCVLGVGRLKLHIEYGLMQDVMSVTYEKCHQDQK
jgi:hypothetical protein